MFFRKVLSLGKSKWFLLESNFDLDLRREYYSAMLLDKSKISYLVFHYLIPPHSCMADSYLLWTWLEQKWKDKLSEQSDSCSPAKIPNPFPPEAGSQSNEHWTGVPLSQLEGRRNPRIQSFSSFSLSQSVPPIKKCKPFVSILRLFYFMISICCVFLGEHTTLILTL